MSPAIDLQNPSQPLLDKLNATILNPEWRLMNFYKIQTKNQTLEKFKLNPIQRRIHYETQNLQRIMHLKSRQVGISTYWLLRELDEVLWTPHTTCAVIAHDRDTIEVLFEIVVRAYNNIPKMKFTANDGSYFTWEKPKADRSNTRMLKFDEMDSKIYVDLQVRGGTVHRLHISESAFVKNMSEVWAATQESVPVKGGRIVVETTANGKGNWFHEQWIQENTWHKLFFGWHDNPDNILNVPKDGPMWKYSKEVVERSLTENEKKLRIEYNLSMEQICWYRYKLESYSEGERHLMAQENPANAEEAFVYTEGRFYPEFSRAIHVIPNLPEGKPPHGVNVYASLDYGWSNPTAIGLWYVDYDGNCFLYKEGYASQWPIKDQAEWLRKNGFNRVNFADPSLFNRTVPNQTTGQVESIAEEYRRHGIILSKANNDKGAGFPRVRDYMRLRDGHKNPVFSTSPAPTFYICEGCTNTIDDFETIRYAKPVGGNAIDQTAREDHEKSEKRSHGVDMARYFLISRPKLPERDENIPPNSPAFRIAKMKAMGKLGGKTDVGVTY